MAQDTPEKSILKKLAQTQTFHPSGAKLFVPDWTLDPGDVITIQSDGVDYDVPIHTMDLTWNGVSTAEIQSTGNQEREPLSALKRKEYQSRRSGYAAQKEAEEKQQQQYQHWVEENDVYRESMYAIVGVQTNAAGDVIYQQATDEQGNLVWETDEQGNLILDDQGNPIPVPARDAAGNKIPVFDPSATGSISGKITETAQNYQSLYQRTGVDRLGNEETLYSKVEQTAEGVTRIYGQTGIVNAVFDPNEGYQKGDRVLYNNVPYEFTQAHHGAWTGTDVKPVGTLQAQITETQTQLSQKITQSDLDGTLTNYLLISEFSSELGSTFTNGDTTLAAQVITAINKNTNQSQVFINADQINLNGSVTATNLDARLIDVDQLFSQSGYTGSISVGTTVTAGSVVADTYYYKDDPNNEEIHTRPVQLLSGDKNYISNISVLAIGTAEIMNLRHYHDIDIEEVTTGTNAGKIKVTIGEAVATSDTENHVDFFKIADTAYYKSHVGISSVEPGSWLYDSTEHKYYNQVTATAKDSTQENPDTVSASVFIPDITLTPVSGLTATGTVKAWGPAVSGTVYAAADDLSLYLKADDEYIYITKTDSTPVSVGPSANVIARMTNEGGGAAYTAGQANVNGQIESITHPSGDTNYLANYLNIDITAVPKLELKSNDTPPVISYITGKTNPDRITQLTDTIQIPVVVTDATLTAGEFTNGKYTITGTGGNVNVDGAGGTNIPVGVTSLTFEPTDAIEAGQQSVTPSLDVDGWRWDGPSGSETLGNSVLASNPYDTSKKQDSVITLPSLSISVTKTGVSVSAADKANVSGVVAVSNHTVTLDTIQETDVPVGQTPELLGDGFYALNYKKQGGTATGWAYYKVSGGTLADGTITDIILQDSKVAYDSTSKTLQVNVQATGTNITNAPYDDSVNLALTSTEVVLKKGEFSNKTTDPNNSQNIYAGQYSVTRDSGGTFKVEGIDTLSVDTSALSFSLELNMPTATLGAQGTTNWDSTNHKYKYKLSSSMNVDNDSSVLKRDTGELVLDPVDAIDFGHENGVSDGQNAMTADGSWGTYTANTNQHVNTFTYQAYTTDTPPVAKGYPQSTDVALSSGLWIGSKQTVYLKEDSTILAEYEVDASDLVTNAKNTVKIEGPTWNNTGDATDANQINFSTDAPTPKTNNESLTLTNSIDVGTWDSTNGLPVTATATVKDSGNVARLAKEETDYLSVAVSNMVLGASFAKTVSDGQTLDYSGKYTLTKASGGLVSVNNTPLTGVEAGISTSGRTEISLSTSIDSVSGTWDSENLQYNLSASGTVKEGNTTRLTASGTGTLVPTDAINYGKSQVGLKTPEWLDSTDDDHQNTYLISTNGRVNSATGDANEAQTYLTPTAAIRYGTSLVTNGTPTWTGSTGVTIDGQTGQHKYQYKLTTSGRLNASGDADEDVDYLDPTDAITYGQNSVKLAKSQSGGVTTISKVTDGTGSDTATVTVTPGTVSVTPGTWNSTSKLLPIGGTGTVDVDGTTLNLTAGSASVSVTPGSVSVTHTWDSTNHQYTVSGTGSVAIGGTTGNLTTYNTPLVPMDAINYGKTLVEQRSATGLSDTITLASTDTGTSDHTAYVEYDDDTDDSISVRINASAVYTAGQNSVTAALVSISAVPSGSTSEELTSGGVYDLQRSESGTVTSHTYYTVPAGGGGVTVDSNLITAGTYVPGNGTSSNPGYYDLTAVATASNGETGTGTLQLVPSDAWSNGYASGAASSSGVGIYKMDWSNGYLSVLLNTWNPSVKSLGVDLSFRNYAGTGSNANSATISVLDGNLSTGLRETLYLHYDSSIPGVVLNKQGESTVLARYLTNSNRVSDLSAITLGASDTGMSTHNVDVTYTDGTFVEDGATVTVDASAIVSGGGEGTTVDHISKSGVVTYSANYKTAYFDVTAYDSENTALHTNRVSADISESYEQGRTAGAGQVVNGTITSVEKYLVGGYEQDYDTNTHKYTVHVKASGTNISNSPYTQDIVVLATRAYNQGLTEGDASSVTITSIDGTSQGDPSSDVNPGKITATASNGDTLDQDLYITEGSWNSSNKKAVNIRVGSDSGTLIARKWITAPSNSSTTHSISSSGSPSVQTGSTSGRKSAGSISGQSVYSARNSGYIFFTMKCGDTTQDFYMTINA